YFMTIPEAVSLVMQASVIGKGGDVLVLDMGEPIKIVSLAEELIKIHGLEPYKDIDIEFIGIRPGEKLFEEILTAEEGTTASKHEKVFIAKNSNRYSKEEMRNILNEFEGVLKHPSADRNEDVRILLKKYVKHFKDEVRRERRFF
ncbi:MAG: polysaccharide biosynthesis protein, partial [Deltaproteobacteria bacterium]|nr:polysaccharide biosynthesis protein [Deltaproteobacteria bacterium]